MAFVSADGWGGRVIGRAEGKGFDGKSVILLRVERLFECALDPYITLYLTLYENPTKKGVRPECYFVMIFDDFVAM